MRPANSAPFYCAIYPELAEITRQCGYALAIHGSMARDFDLICIPWTEAPSAPDDVVQAIMGKFDFKPVGGLTDKRHGRRVQTLAFMGECFLDLSFVPVASTATGVNDEGSNRETLEKVCTNDPDHDPKNENIASGIELAARFVDRRRDDYVREHGSYDGSTGMTEFPGNGDEYVYELEEIAEGIRALATPTSSKGCADV